MRGRQRRLRETTLAKLQKINLEKVFIKQMPPDGKNQVAFFFVHIFGLIFFAVFQDFPATQLRMARPAKAGRRALTRGCKAAVMRGRRRV